MTQLNISIINKTLLNLLSLFGILFMKSANILKL